MTHDSSDEDEGAGSGRRALLGLALLAMLIVAVVFVIHKLHTAAQIQDCVAAGRTNCAPITTR